MGSGFLENASVDSLSLLRVSESFALLPTFQPLLHFFDFIGHEFGESETTSHGSHYFDTTSVEILVPEHWWQPENSTGRTTSLNKW